MTDDAQIFRSTFSRRGLLTAAAVIGAGAVVEPVLGGGVAAAAEPVASQQSPWAPDPVGTPRVNGLHLQFGVEAATEVIVSWHTLQPVRRPRVLLGEPNGRYSRSVPASRAGYTDAKSGTVVYAYHARLSDLASSHDYVYAAIHQGAEPEFGAFRTGPVGREPFTFTSSAIRAPRRRARSTSLRWESPSPILRL